MSKNDNHGYGFFTFLVGGVLGATIGLIYAPRSGRETRAILLDEGDELVHKAVSSIQVAQDRALSSIEEAQARMEALNDETRERIQKLQKIARETLNEQRESVKKGYSKAREAIVE